MLFFKKKEKVSIVEFVTNNRFKEGYAGKNSLNKLNAIDMSKSYARFEDYEIKSFSMQKDVKKELILYFSTVYAPKKGKEVNLYCMAFDANDNFSLNLIDDKEIVNDILGRIGPLDFILGVNPNVVRLNQRFFYGRKY